MTIMPQDVNAEMVNLDYPDVSSLPRSISGHSKVGMVLLGRVVYVFVENEEKRIKGSR